MSNNDKTFVKREWVKSIGTIFIGIATVLVSIFIGVAANIITKTQMEIANNNAVNQMEINDKNNEKDRQLKTIEIFLELIKSEKPREKEMAVRLLHTLDKDMALDFAVSIATNKSEDADIAMAAFRIGKQIDSVRFLESILKVMNISLSDYQRDTVREDYLGDFSSGYQQLSEVLYSVLKRHTLDGDKVPLDNIFDSVREKHGRDEKNPILEISSFNDVFVRESVFEKWREKNRASRARSFEEIIY